MAVELHRYRGGEWKGLPRQQENQRTGIQEQLQDYMTSQRGQMAQSSPPIQCSVEKILVDVFDSLLYNFTEEWFFSRNREYLPCRKDILYEKLFEKNMKGMQGRSPDGQGNTTSSSI